nr:hypothetical protein [Marinitoga lauensis]
MLISGPGTIVVTTEDATIYQYYADYDSAGEYDVTIRVTDGLEKADSTFTITVLNKNRPPEKPTIKYPYNNSKNIPISNLKFEWECIDLDNDEDITYSIYLSPSKEKVENNSEDALIIENYKQNNYTLESTLDYLTTYYIKVEAKDSFGATSISDIVSFTTEEKPAIIEISDLELKNGETGVATISTKDLYSVNGLKNIEIVYNPQYIEIDETQASSGVDFLRKNIPVFFEDVEVKEYSPDKKSIVINIAFSKGANVTILEGDIIKLYFKAKKIGTSIIFFKSAEG